MILIQEESDKASKILHVIYRTLIRRGGCKRIRNRIAIYGKWTFSITTAVMDEKMGKTKASNWDFYFNVNVFYIWNIDLSKSL